MTYVKNDVCYECLTRSSLVLTDTLQCCRFSVGVQRTSKDSSNTGRSASAKESRFDGWWSTSATKVLRLFTNTTSGIWRPHVWWVTSSLSFTTANMFIGGFRGGPSRLWPPLLATDRRRHCTPDKWQRYCVMATCSSEYSKWLPPVAFSQLYKAQKFPAVELTALPQTLCSWFKLIFSQL